LGIGRPINAFSQIILDSRAISFPYAVALNTHEHHRGAHSNKAMPVDIDLWVDAAIIDLGHTEASLGNYSVRIRRSTSSD